MVDPMPAELKLVAQPQTAVAEARLLAPEQSLALVNKIAPECRVPVAVFSLRGDASLVRRIVASVGQGARPTTPASQTPRP